MSRFCEGDGENPFGYLWNYMVYRSADSARGQQVLADMRAALLAIPDRRLAHSSLLTKTGETCAVGAFAKAKDVDLEPFRDKDLGDRYVANADAHDTIEVGVQAGMQRMLARHFSYMNDVELPPPEYRVHSHAVPVAVVDESREAFRRALMSPLSRLWDGNYAHHPMLSTEYGYTITGSGHEYRGYTPEQRWQAVYDWVCKNLRIEYPPALVTA